ncbi:unnamed protein product [Ectocarpus sp. 13 AM-2016]
MEGGNRRSLLLPLQLSLLFARRLRRHWATAPPAAPRARPSSRRPCRFGPRSRCSSEQPGRRERRGGIEAGPWGHRQRATGNPWGARSRRKREWAFLANVDHSQLPPALKNGGLAKALSFPSSPRLGRGGSTPGFVANMTDPIADKGVVSSHGS